MPLNRWRVNAAIAAMATPDTTNTAGSEKKLDLLREYKVASVDPKPTERVCPRCQKHLGRTNYKEMPGLQVEACPDKCGMYLDKGELEKVRLID